MPTLNKRNEGDITYEVVDANLKGGVLVIPSTTATSDPSLQGVKVATDAAVNVVGILGTDCVTAANQAAAQSFTGSDPGDYAFTDVSVPGPTSVVYDHGFFPMTYTAVAVAYGIKLCAAASGAVRAWVSGTDPASSIIGWCAQPGGVGSGGGVALGHLGL